MKKLQQTLWISTLILLTTGTAPAQAPDIEWQKAFGGSAGESASSILQTADGGYIMAGYSESNDGDLIENKGEDDLWIVKTNSNGEIEWQKTYGGSANDNAKSIRQTADGGYIVGGTTFSNDGDVTGNHGNHDIWVVKLDAVGDLVWQLTLGGSNQDVLEMIEQTTDNGYIIAGTSNSTNGNVTGNHGGYDYWIVKLSESGNITWQKSYGGTGHDAVAAVQQTMDGGYIVAGASSSTDGNVTGNHGESDYWVIKLSPAGIIEWQKSLGGSISDSATHILQTSDGGYVVSGLSSSHDGDVSGNHGDSDFWIVKLNETGTIIWQKSLGGSSEERPYHIQQTTDNGYVIAGYSESSNGDVTQNQGKADFWIVKLTDSGSIDWQKSLGGAEDDKAYSIQQTTDGGYIIAGYSESNNGDVTGNHGGADFWIVKLDPDSLSTNEFNNEITVYPNPVTTVLNIAANEPISSVAVFNMFGQQVYHQQLEATSGQINLSVLASGIYMVKVNSADKEAIYKVIKK